MADIDISLGTSNYIPEAARVVKANSDMMNSMRGASTALASLEGQFGSFGRSMTSMSVASKALMDLQAPVKSLNTHLHQLGERIVRIGATIGVFASIGLAVNGVTAFVRSSIAAIEEYQVTIMALTAALTQTAMLVQKQNTGSQDVPKAYRESAEYAERLAVAMRSVDRESVANYQDIMKMLQVYTSLGNVLNTNNETQMRGFTALSNAIPMMTTGLDKQRQMATEMRALMTGNVRAGADVAQSIQNMSKTAGTGTLKELYAKAAKDGVDKLTAIMPYLEGYAAIAIKAGKSLMGAKTTFETAFQAMQRTAFQGMASDIARMMVQASEAVDKGTGTVGRIVNEAWTKVKETLFTVSTAADGITKVFALKPEILANLYKFAEIMKTIGGGVLSLITGFVKYFDVISNLAIAYTVSKVSALGYWLVEQASNAIMVFKLKMMTNLNALQAEAILMDKARTASIIIANEAQMTMEAKKATMAATSLAAQEAKNAALFQSNQLIVRNTPVEMASLEAKRMHVAMLLEENAALISGTVAAGRKAEADMAAAAAAVAATKPASTRIITQGPAQDQAHAAAKVALTEATAAYAAVELEMQNIMKNGLVLSEQNILLTNKLIASKMALRDAEIAMMLPGAKLAAEAYNLALVKRGITTGFVTAAQLANNQVTFASMGPTMRAAELEVAHAEALGMATVMAERKVISMMALIAAVELYTKSLGLNVLTTNGLTVAASGLSKVFSMLGGWFTAAIAAGYLMYKMWDELNQMEEKYANDRKERDKLDPLVLAEGRVQELMNQMRKQGETPVDALKRETSEAQQKVEIAQQELEILKETKSLQEGRGAKKALADYDNGEGFTLFKNLALGYADTLDQIAKKEKLIGNLTHITQKEGFAKSGIGVPESAKPFVEPDKKAESAYKSLIKEAEGWDVKAKASGKTTDELSAKFEELKQQWENISGSDKVKEAMLFDAKGTLEAVEKIRTAINLFYENFKIGYDKKGASLLEEAKEAKSVAQYKSNLDLRKSELQANLEDRKINQTQYFDFIGKMIEEEAGREILAQQKVVDSKKVLLAEAQTKYPGNQGLIDRSQAEVIKEEINLDKVRSDAGKRYVDNIRAATKALEEQRKALVALESKNKVDATQLTADRSKTDKQGFGFQAIDDQLAADKAAITAKYDMEREELLTKWDMLRGMNNWELESIQIAHEARMVAIDAENLLRIQSLPKEEKDKATIDYERNKVAIVERYAKQSEDIKAKSIKQSASFETAIVKALNLTYQKERQEQLSEEQKATKAKISLVGQYAGFAASMMTMIADTQDQTSKEGFETAKAFNIGAAIMSTAAAVMNALATVQPYPLAVAAAAMAAATGAIQIAKISSTSFGGGGGVSAPAGSIGGGGGSGGGSLQNVAMPKTSLEDSQVYKRDDILAEAIDRNSVSIGRLSKSMDYLSGLFETGGAGMGLATNAPGRFAETTSDSFTKGLKADFTTAFNSTIYSGGATLMGDMLSGGANSITSLVTSVIKNSMGSGKWQTMARGMSIDTSGGMADVDNYERMKKKKNWSVSRQTLYTENQDASDIINALLQPLVVDLGQMADTLGLLFDPTKYKAAATRIETSGKSAEDIGKELTALLKTTMDSMALTIPGIEKLGGAYDNMFDRVVAINNAYVTANAQLQLIGDNPIDFDTTIQSTLDFAIDMENAIVSLWGGLDKYAESMGSYREVMYTDAERNAQDVSDYTRKIFTKWGNEIGGEEPATIAAFNALRDATDPASPLYKSLTDIGILFGSRAALIDDLAESTRELTDTYRDMSMELLDLKGLKGTVEYLDLLNEKREAEVALLDPTLQAIQRQIYAQQDLNDAMEKTTTALKTTVDIALEAANTMRSIKGTNSSPESAYTDAKAAWDTNTDVSKWSSLGQALISASKTYNASGAGFQTDYQAVMTKLGTLAGITDITTPNIIRQTNYLETIDKALNDPTSKLFSVLGSLSPNSNIQTIIDATKAANENVAVNFSTAATTAMQMAVGKLPQDSRYDVGPVINGVSSPNGRVDTGDAIVLLSLAAGLRNGTLSLDAVQKYFPNNTIPRFGAGGITNGISIAGEGMYREAVVPLLDGRTIPVRINGSADNKGIEDRLDALIENGRNVERRLTSIETKARLVANA